MILSLKIRYCKSPDTLNVMPSDFLQGCTCPEPYRDTYDLAGDEEAVDVNDLTLFADEFHR